MTDRTSRRKHEDITVTSPAIEKQDGLAQMLRIVLLNHVDALDMKEK